jgi:hypothetical protein
MRKLTLILIAATAMVFAGLLVWKAEAMPAAGAANIGAVSKSLSPVEKAACGGWGRHCRPGRHWVCRPRGCWCAPC